MRLARFAELHHRSSSACASVPSTCFAMQWVYFELMLELLARYWQALLRSYPFRFGWRKPGTLTRSRSRQACEILWHQLQVQVCDRCHATRKRAVFFLTISGRTVSQALSERRHPSRCEAREADWHPYLHRCLQDAEAHRAAALAQVRPNVRGLS